jgi:hypothetical protein
MSSRPTPGGWLLADLQQLGTSGPFIFVRKPDSRRRRDAHSGPAMAPASGKKRLFLYGPAHRAQMLAKAQGGRVLAFRKIGAELYLAA